MPTENCGKLESSQRKNIYIYSLVSFIFELDFGEMFILISNDTCNDANKRTLSVGLNIKQAIKQNIFHSALPC